MEGRANELNMTNGIHTKCDKTFYSGGVIRYLVLDWKSGERDKSTDLNRNAKKETKLCLQMSDRDNA